MTRANLISCVLSFVALAAVAVAGVQVSRVSGAVADLEGRIADAGKGAAAPADAAGGPDPRIAELEAEVRKLQKMLSEIGVPSSTGSGLTRGDIRAAVDRYFEEKELAARAAESKRLSEKLTRDAAAHISRMDKLMSLSEAQKLQIEEILKKQIVEGLALRGSVADLTQVSDQMAAKDEAARLAIRTLLTPEQAHKFDGMKGSWHDRLLGGN